jgi:hypothetical protein
MNRLRTLITISLLLLTTNALAQQATPKQKLIGTWTLVFVDNVLPDGSRIQLYGPNPQGILTLGANGRYALQIFRAGRPRFAANDKSKGTPEENQAAVQGSNSHFGRYSVNESDHTITFHIEHASFPNWEGTEQKRSFTITSTAAGDELKYTVPAPTTGTAATGEVGWKRAE